MEKLKSLKEVELEVEKEDKLILFISQDNCGKCAVLEFGVPSYMQALELDIPVVSINIDHLEEGREAASSYYDITSTPTLIAFKGGEKVGRQNSVDGIQQLDALVKDLGIELG